jgi:hypothetical protein
MIPTLQLGQLGLSLLNSRPLWTPRNLANPPSIWLRDDSPVTFSSGLTLSSITDISTNALVFTAGVPVNNTGLNSRRTIAFTGSSTVIKNTGAVAKALSNNTGKIWAFIVYKNTSTSAAVRHWVYTSTNTSAAARFNIRDNGTTIRRTSLAVRRLDADALASLNAAAANDTNFHMELHVMDYTNRTGTIYKDGSSDATNATLTTAGSTSATDAIEGICFGATSTGGSPVIGEIAEVFMGFGSIPTADERARMFGYAAAAQRWGLQSLLPTSSPYKTTAPTV